MSLNKETKPNHPHELIFHLTITLMPFLIFHNVPAAVQILSTQLNNEFYLHKKQFENVSIRQNI